MLSRKQARRMVGASRRRIWRHARRTVGAATRARLSMAESIWFGRNDVASMFIEHWLPRYGADNPALRREFHSRMVAMLRIEREARRAHTP